jgi:hypothetical protein
MSSDQPLHEHDETHLWKRTFAELVARNIDPNDEILLIVANSEGEATQLETSIKQNLHTALQKCLTYTGDQEDLPYDPNSVDITVNLNPKQNPYKYHQPLYQVTDVTRKGGTIIYRAPQRLAHSEKAELDTIYSLDWESNSDPSLAALMAVTEHTPDGEQAETAGPTEDSTSETTISAFRKGSP